MSVALHLARISCQYLPLLALVNPRTTTIEWGKIWSHYPGLDPILRPLLKHGRKRAFFITNGFHCYLKVPQAQLLVNLEPFRYFSSRACGRISTANIKALGDELQRLARQQAWLKPRLSVKKPCVIFWQSCNGNGFVRGWLQAQHLYALDFKIGSCLVRFSTEIGGENWMALTDQTWYKLIVPAKKLATPTKRVWKKKIPPLVALEKKIIQA